MFILIDLNKNDSNRLRIRELTTKELYQYLYTDGGYYRSFLALYETTKDKKLINQYTQYKINGDNLLFYNDKLEHTATIKPTIKEKTILKPAYNNYTKMDSIFRLGSYLNGIVLTAKLDTILNELENIKVEHLHKYYIIVNSNIRIIDKKGSKEYNLINPYNNEVDILNEISKTKEYKDYIVTDVK